MKIETAELQFIRDGKGYRWFVACEDGDHILHSTTNTAEEVYTWIVSHGYLTPDPLEEALEAIDEESTFMQYHRDSQFVPAKCAKTLLRKLAADLTAEEK